MITRDRIKAIFQEYGRDVNGREFALIHAISEAVAPQRTWEGLSIFEIDELVYETEYDDYHDLVKRTEALLEEKNNGSR